MSAFEVITDKSNLKIFETVAITVTQTEEGCLHDLEYGVGSVRRVLGRDLPDTEFQWVIPDMTDYFGSAMEGKVTIYCIRKKNGRYIGGASCDLQVNALVRSTPTVIPNAVRIGDSVTIKTNRIHPEYTHRISVRISEDEQFAVIAENVADSCSWTVPRELLDIVNGELEKTVTIRCETFNGAKPVIGDNVADTTELRIAAPAATRAVTPKDASTLGQTVSLELSPADARFLHNLRFVIAENELDSWVNIPGGVYEWTIPDSVLPYIAGTEGYIEVACETFAGTTSLGENVTEIPVRLQQTESLCPKVNVSLSADNIFLQISQSINEKIFLDGWSKLIVSYEGSTAAEGAEIASCITEVMGERLVGQSVKTARRINTSGTLAVKCTVIDTRGFQSTDVQFVYVAPYKKPQIIGSGENKKIRCIRCDVNGEPNRKGTGLLIQGFVQFQKIYAEGQQVNYAMLGVLLNGKAVNTGNEEENIILKDEQSIDFVLEDTYIDPGKAYKVTVNVMDAIGGLTTYDIPVGPAFAACHVPKGGRGFTLGGYHDPAKVNVFDCLFDAHGRVMGLGGLPGMTSSNRTEPGMYAVEDASSLGLSQMKGVLKVWNSEGLKDDETLHRKQKFICADTEIDYQRSLTRSTAEDAWTEGPWKSKEWE